MTEDAEIIIVAIGIAARVSKSAIDEARAMGIKVGLVRPITVYPFPTKAFDKIKENPNVKNILTVELNMGQMTDDVKLALECKKPVELLRHSGGIVPTPKEVLAKLCELNGGNK